MLWNLHGPNLGRTRFYDFFRLDPGFGLLDEKFNSTFGGKVGPRQGRGSNYSLTFGCFRMRIPEVCVAPLRAPESVCLSKRTQLAPCESETWEQGLRARGSDAKLGQSASTLWRRGLCGVQKEAFFPLFGPTPNQPKNDRCLTFTIETS